MALKPIFQIEIDDSRFKAFKTLFDRYKKEVEKLPGEWGKLNEGIGETKTLMERLAELAERQAGGAENRAEAEQKSNKFAEAAVGLWGTVRQQVSNVNQNITDATKSLVRWSTLTTAFAGLLGVGSLFGLDRLAHSIAAQRRQSMGLGVGYGQNAAFQTNYGRVLSNPASLLSGAMQAKYDYTSDAYNAMLNAGVGPGFIRSHNSAEISREFLQHLDTVFADIKGKGHEGEIGARAKAMHLESSGLSLKDIVAYLSLEGAEKQRMGNSLTGDSSTMNVSEEAQKRWADLVTQLDRAGKQIEGVFMTRVAALAPAIESLSKSLVEAAVRFADSGTFKKWGDAVGDAIQGAANWLAPGGDFDKAEAGFIILIEKAASALTSFVRWVAQYVPDITPPGGGAPGSWNSGKRPWTSPGDSPENLPGAASGHVGSPPAGVAPKDTGKGAMYFPARAAALPPAGREGEHLARNLRNNNPGNLVANNWTATLPGYVGSDGHFAIFDSMDNGYRAANANLDSYARRGLRTPMQIVGRWAPANSGEGNDPGAYAEHIRRLTGLDPYAPLGDDAESRARMLMGITTVESGRRSPFRVDQISPVIDQQWRSTGRLPSVRVRSNTGGNPFPSTYGTSYPSAPAQ